MRTLRLNDRSVLVRLRVDRKNLRRTYEAELKRIRKALRNWDQIVGVNPTRRALRLRDECERLVAVYKEFVSRDPFALGELPPPVPASLFAT